MRITDNIYLLSGAGHGQIGNVYAVRNENRLFLVDTGEDGAALEIIQDNLKYHKLSDLPITDVIITHMHIDHTGNAWYFRERGARIIMSDQDAGGLETGGIRVNDYGLKPYITCKVDRRLRDGDILNINGVRVKATLVPGHTNGSMLYQFVIDGKSVVCTGDFVFPVPGEFDEGFDVSFGWKGSYEFNKGKYIKSLEKSLTVSADILLGGHGVPVMINGDQILKKGFRKAMCEYR